MTKTQRNIYLTVLAVCLLALMSVSMFVSRITAPRQMSEQEMKLNGAYVFDKPRVIKAISLVDQNGEPFTLENLQGRWTLLFFGYTYCPDICPTTLADLKKVAAMLDDTEFAEDTQFVLVSADPARDTPDKLKEYVQFFDPDFVGVTGDFMAIQSLASNVNAAFTKVPLKDGSDGAYLVDHTANIILVNPYGHYHGFFKPQATLSQGQFDPGKLKITYQSIRAGFKGD